MLTTALVGLAALEAAGTGSRGAFLGAIWALDFGSEGVEAQGLSV
jgi:hypothetical protein